MIRRCYDSSRPSFKAYGGAGIFVCEFLRASYSNLIDLIGMRPEGDFSIDRIDNKKGYFCGDCAECCSKGESKNVRWGTRIQQNRNRGFVHKILIHGEILTPPEISEKYDINYRTIKTRISKGWTGLDLIIPTQTPTEFLFRGKPRTIPQIQKLTGISRSTLNSRAYRSSGDYHAFSSL